ncbi:MAG: glycosyltransferase [Saprospiraceae bacterium]
MLSICIPVYNFDIRSLVADLHVQAEKQSIPFEILIFDDASEDKFIFLNREIASLTHVRWMELPTNIGRSRIRNQLAEMAQFDNLLFLDCDSKVVGSDFIENYIKEIHPSNLVICGGRTHEAQPPDETLYLRWWYGKNREEKSAKDRSLFPNRSFLSNNFLIQKKLLLEIRFEEKLSGYGHEDSLFGYELKKRGIKIFHIDNPLAHIGLEPSQVFLKKTEEGIKNLYYIMNNLPEYASMADDVRLMKVFKKLNRFGMSKLLAVWFSYRKKHLQGKILGPKPDLKSFDFYKLGFLCALSQNKIPD